MAIGYSVIVGGVGMVTFTYGEIMMYATLPGSLNAIYPAAKCLQESKDGNHAEAFRKAAVAAAEGSESTKAMRSVHGRAAYYGEKSIGLLDGGSVVGKLIFEALA